MQRLYDFLRRHPTGVDSFWALGLLGFGSLMVVFDRAGAVHMAAAAVFVVGLSLVVALRRKAPVQMLLLTAAIGVGQLITGVQPNPSDFAMLVIAYTVASAPAVPRWASRCALAGALLGPALTYWRYAYDDETRPVTANLVFTTLITVPFVLAWVLGDSMRTRRAYWAQLEERAARLEKEREAQSRIAVAAERARIARELHDVVAHNVSVMVVQADGAAYVLDAAPEQTRQALETISGTGRQALAEMRRLLGVLRTGEQAEGGEYVPQPGVEQLEDLMDQVRGAGLPVDFTVEGEPRELPSSVALTVYRIVQEALTNTRKHGGPDVGATVRVSYRDEDLELLVEDDGRGAQQELYEEGGADGLGHGLIGMRERVGMVGGSLTAGPRPGGGFRVSAVLPLKPAR
ncbi:signal transduction histidine kinase [Streptomyces sp. 2333.5]|uniref:sensor histidine kinase n=1 Tax=Streptomyces TaxID=1883 RepID=UPI00089CC533|nr:MULTISPECIES: sensor histidine kinase [unclassified Streptomyces]PJJ03579.1 signal transduction histidine kinase [Streptomyces sp. 2333.5]SED33573.1 Signal transduction histidine kinase [Streptomyces sp. 2314.4]SEE51076.1 Signal transduction histidine kinase [Streptomyces sp. 2112.2]SOE12037.1 Signal transduction histidine kinase [Streptomyces sp. 2323.1]